MTVPFADDALTCSAVACPSGAVSVVLSRLMLVSPHEVNASLYANKLVVAKSASCTAATSAARLREVPAVGM